MITAADALQGFIEVTVLRDSMDAQLTMRRAVVGLRNIASITEPSGQDYGARIVLWEVPLSLSSWVFRNEGDDEPRSYREVLVKETYADVRGQVWLAIDRPGIVTAADYTKYIQECLTLEGPVTPMKLRWKDKPSAAADTER